MTFTEQDIKGMSQEKLKALIARRHPEYKSRLKHWIFCEDTYNGGRKWFDDNVFKYIKEGDDEYKKRVARAYRFNHTREVVDLVNKYIFKSRIDRSKDAPLELQEFWAAATVHGRKVDHLMRVASQKASVFGRPWIVIDNNIPEEVKTRADQKKSGGRVYAYCVSPIDVLDLSWGEDGDLDWILLRETSRDDVDPLTSTGEVSEVFRIWTRQSWAKLSVKKGDTKEDISIELKGFKNHGIGIVPVVPLDDRDTEDAYISHALIEDIAYLDRAVANYLSNLDAIIQDQTFSQLTIPAQAIVGGGGEDVTGVENVSARDNNSLIEMGTKRIFTYDGQSSRGPAYISPDPSQAELILSAINKIIHEIYHSVGMAGERTKQDNATGIDNSSGVAKAYDFERMNAMLGNKAKSLEGAENKISQIVMAWHGKNVNLREVKSLVSYPEDFDVRSLNDEFDIANKFQLLSAPKTLRQEQMKRLIEKLYPQLPRQLVNKIKEEIDSTWLDLNSDQGATVKELPPKILPGHQNRQGQNNKEAKKGASDSAKK